MSRRNRVLNLFLLLLIQLQLHLVHATATCYEPDGTAVTDPRYKPCIAIENEFSMCCRLNDTNPDLCYPNGLCYWTAKNEYWRNFCTDQTWESPNCIPNTTCNAAVSLIDKLTGTIASCPDSRASTIQYLHRLQSGAEGNRTAQFILCTDGSYCCGTNNDCCTSDQEFTLKATLVAMNRNVTNTATSTATITATITGESRGHDNKTVAVGVGVGVSLGVLAVAMLGAGFFWGRRNTQAKYEALQQSMPGVKRNSVAQLPGDSVVHEATGSSGPRTVGSSAPETTSPPSMVIELPVNK